MTTVRVRVPPAVVQDVLIIAGEQVRTQFNSCNDLNDFQDVLYAELTSGTNQCGRSA